MLTLTRRAGEALELHLAPDVDPNTPIRDILGGGPIVVQVSAIRTSQVSITIDAPPEIIIIRDELGKTDEFDSKSGFDEA